MARAWADLLPDLLRLISGSIRDPGDFVRFHAVCSSWRDTLRAESSKHPPLSSSKSNCPPPPRLPWLLGPGSPSHPSIAVFRSIFSKTKTTWCAPGTYSGRHRWLSTEDGTGTWLLTAGGSSPPRLINPFNGGAIILPPLPEKIEEHFQYVDGVVCSDGTVFLHALLQGDQLFPFPSILAAELQPGAAWWREDREILMHNCFAVRFSAACLNGSVVLVDPCQKFMVTLGGVPGTEDLIVDILQTNRLDGPREDGLQRLTLPHRHRHSVHVFESRGQLMVACVVLLNSPAFMDLASALSVWIYVHQEPGALYVFGAHHDHRWERRDGLSLINDRVLFLGCPTSLVLDAVEGDGGCAYFVLNSGNANWHGRPLPEASRVYRYSFKDSTAREVDELPLGAGWKDDTAMMWFRPRPSAIVPVAEIRERLLQVQSSKKAVPSPIIIRRGRTKLGPAFKIFVGNLPALVERKELAQFFQKYGDVTDQRIIRDPKTGKSYGYGFVTMATFEEQAEFFTMIEGQDFFGHVLRVKKQSASRRPKGPFVMPLLAQTGRI